ncbi:MAG: hypothetical protein AAF688_10190 [Bacteroidota bacterium]
MKNYAKYFLLLMLISSCKKELQSNKNEKSSEMIDFTISKIEEENFDIADIDYSFKSGTIENFDIEGKSIDLYWIDKDRDTILKFYRRYDKNGNLIGARYYEEGDIKPSRDTVYINAEGHKVEASLNGDGKVIWKMTIFTDDNDNPVLKRYENGKGDYRGLDSLFFDDNGRVIKGFYENSKGRRYSIKTYNYLESDKAGNWIERMMYVNDTLKQRQLRRITYYDK